MSLFNFFSFNLWLSLAAEIFSFILCWFHRVDDAARAALYLGRVCEIRGAGGVGLGRGNHRRSHATLNSQTTAAAYAPATSLG